MKIFFAALMMLVVCVSNGQSLVKVSESATDVSIAPFGVYKGLKRITGDSLGLDLESLGSPFVITGTDRFTAWDPEGNSNVGVSFSMITDQLIDSVQQDNIASNTIIGNNTGSPGPSMELTRSQVAKMIQNYFDSISIRSGQVDGYRINRRNSGLAFPVTTFYPDQPAKTIAFDIMPSDGAGDFSNNGLAWIDIVDRNVQNSNPPMATARIGIGSSVIEYGERTFNGGTVKPIWFGIDYDPTFKVLTNKKLEILKTAYLTGVRLGFDNANPTMNIGMPDIATGTTATTGITWSDGFTNDYGIYKTSGVFSAPDYQQLKIKFSTGIILDGGSSFGKSYVDVQSKAVFNGWVGVGLTNPSALMHFKAGTATAGTSPLKFTTGANLTTPEAGAMEWDGTNLYITQATGPTRKTIAYAENSFTNGGNSFGSTANLGTNDAFGLNLETNNTNRLLLDSGGRLFSGTLTDVNLTATDSIYFSGGSKVDFVGSGNMLFTGLLNQNFVAGNIWSATASDSASLIASNFNRIGTTNDKILFDESTDVISVQPDGVVTAEFAGPSLTTFTSQTVRLDAYASGTAPALALREDDANGTNEISLKSPATLGADYTQTLTAATGEIPVVIKGSGSLNFPSTTGGTCQDLTITLAVSTLVDGDPVDVGPPLASVPANGQFTAFVSGSNTVTVRFCTPITEDPAIGTFKVYVQK